jgi:hypothetical protein
MVRGEELPKGAPKGEAEITRYLREQALRKTNLQLKHEIRGII